MNQDILNIHPDCQEFFFNFKDFPGKAQDYIACAGISTLRTEYQIGKTGQGEQFGNKQQKRINVHYLLVTRSGQGKITLNNKQYKLTANSIVLLPAGTAFLYELDGEFWDMSWLLLHDCQQYQFIHQLEAAVFSNTNANKLYQTMALLKEFNHNNEEINTNIVLRLVEVLLFQIEQTLNKNANRTEQQVRFHALMQSVTKQLQLPWTVQTLAKKLYISEPQFYRLCKKETGMTPMKYLTHARLGYACYLLQYTHYNLEQIADTIGYADSASFAHRFKLHYQISPGRWRNKVE